MTTFMAPPPAATFLAFHPQDNNIIAIGMEDSSIQIYNVRVDEVFALIPQNFNFFYWRLKSMSKQFEIFHFTGQNKVKRSSEKNYRPCLLSLSKCPGVFWS